MLNNPESELVDHVFAHILQELSGTLLGLSQDRPLLLAVDDLRYADIPSQQCLSYLARRLGTARCLMVLNEPRRTPPGSNDFHAELVRQPHSQQLRLRPLTERGVWTLLTERLGETAADKFAAECHALSGGNAMLVLGLIEDYPAAGRSAHRPAPVPASAARY